MDNETQRDQAPQNERGSLPTRRHHIWRLVFAVALAIGMGFTAGYAVATHVLWAKAAAGRRPVNDIMERLREPLPAAPGTEVLEQHVASSGVGWENPGRINEACSLLYEKQIRLTYTSDLAKGPEDRLDRERRLSQVRKFYEDYFLSLGLVRGNTHAPDANSTVQYGPRCVFYVCADYSLVGPNDRECILVHILLFDSGYAAPKR
ncbi:MAG: hypothetical protein WBD63_00740 [Phycisphaerae bacterium]|nr:hypothetical protein [Phycisphaerae bacterium]